MVSTRSVRAGRAYVEVYSDDSKLTQGLARAHNKLVDFGNTVSAIGKGMMKAGLITALPYAISTKIFKGFSDTMVSVKAVVGATADEYDMLVDKAKLLGRTTSFTAEQVASGMLELGRAGFDPTEIDNAIAAVLNLARATGTELPEATGFAGATLRSFGLASSEMIRVADVLTAAVNNSAQTLTDMGEAMKYAAPIAAEFGMTLEDTAKSIGILANFGIKGSQAGTTLRTVMLQLADSTVRSQIEKMGVSVANQAGQFRNLADILSDIGVATSKLSNIERLSILKDLFQKRGVAGGAKLTAESFERLDNAIDNASGTAQRTAKIMDSEIGGAFRRLFSAAEGMAIALGKSVAEPLSRMAALLTVVSGKISTFIERHETLTRIVGGLGVGLITTGAALFTFGKIIKLITFGIKTAVTVTRNLIATQAVLKAMSGPAGWAALAAGIGLAAAALISIDTIIDSHIDSLDSAGVSADSFADAQKRIGDVSKDSAAAVRSMTQAMNEKKDWSPIKSLGVKADEMDLDEFEVAELRLKKADNWNRQTQNLLKLYKKVIQEKKTQLDLEKEAQETIADNITPQQAYNAEVEKLDHLLTKKLLTEEQYNRALAQQQKELQDRSVTPEQQAQQDLASDLIEDTRTPAEEFKKRMAEIIDIFQKGLIDESTYKKAGQNLRRELFADTDWFKFDDQIAKETDQLDALKQKGLISEGAYTRGRAELDKRGEGTDQLKKIEQYQEQMQALQGLFDSGLLRKGEFTKAERDLRKELGIKGQFQAQKSLDLAGVTSTGTFSSMALGGLSAGSTTDRIADSTEEVAKNTKQILRKMAEGQNFL